MLQMLPRLDCGTDFDCTSTTTLTGGSKTTTLTPFVTCRIFCGFVEDGDTPRTSNIGKLFGNDTLWQT